MDVARQEPRTTSHRDYLLVGALGLVSVVGLAAVMLLTAKASPPTYTVRTASLTQQVLGRGTLVPSNIAIVAAGAEGTVVKIQAAPGDHVTTDTVIAQLVNPGIEQQYTSAQQKVAGMRADNEALHAQLAEQEIEHETAILEANSAKTIAQSEFNATRTLFEKGIVSKLAFEKTKASVAQSEAHATFAQQRLKLYQRVEAAKLKSAATLLSQAEEDVQRLQKQRETLAVRPGAEGTLTKIEVTAGQHIPAGGAVAEVIGPQLRADIQIAQSQIDQVNPGMAVSLRFPQGIMAAHVKAVLPRSTDGQAHVIATLDNDAHWARADMVCDATFAAGPPTAAGLVVQAPAGAKANSEVIVEVRNTDGTAGARKVVFGQRSGSDLVVTSGLSRGETISSVLPEDGR